MAEKEKSGCGCGCLPLGTKTPKEGGKVPKPKAEKPKK